MCTHTDVLFRYVYIEISIYDLISYREEKEDEAAYTVEFKGIRNRNKSIP